jgi:hypothetical protein
VIARLVQWLATVVVAAAGFVLGVNHAGPATYTTPAGVVRVQIRLSWPGDLLEIVVPQVPPHPYVRRVQPFRAPLVWRATVLQASPAARSAVRRGDPIALTQLVIESRTAVERSAARSFASGVAGALIGAIALAVLFIVVLGRPVTRLMVALFAIAPLLAAGAAAYVVASRGVLP